MSAPNSPQTRKSDLKTVILVERAGDIFKARLKDETDVNAVWAGRTAAEAVGKLIIGLCFSLNLRVIQKG